MDIILQCQERFDRLAILHWPSLSITDVEREAVQCGEPISGHYSSLGGRFTAFFRCQGDLYLLQERLLQISERVSSIIEVADNESQLMLLEGGTVIAEIHAVNAPTVVPISTDPTPFVEEEDFNFLLFVHNVLTSPDRRERIYQSSKG
jgi:hypothetical protein